MVSFHLLIFCVFYGVGLTQSEEHIECGEPVPEVIRVVGGKIVKTGSWPWMVSLNWLRPTSGTAGTARTGHICGGVLLHSQWVLTAAHCLDMPGKPNVFPSSPPRQWRVTAGMHDRTEADMASGRWQTRTIKRFIYHKDFQDKIVSAVNDIALIQLSRPFNYTDYVRPICLPAGQKPKPGWNRCYAAGWGKESENSTRYSLSLQDVPIPIVNQWFCYARYPDKYIAGKHICGGDWYHGNRDTCKGDSGGPLACQGKDKKWYVAGIISWGVGCGRKRTPGVYTNVEAYERWIIQAVRKFTYYPKVKKLTQPRAYISKHDKNRRKRNVGVRDIMVSSPYHIQSSEREMLRAKTLLREKRQAALSLKQQNSSFLSMLTNYLNTRREFTKEQS